MNLLRPKLLDALAREHALGQLRGGAARCFQRLLRDERQARRALADWQEQLAVLADGVPEQAPRPQVWEQLQRRLFPQPSGPAEAAPARRWWSRWRFGGPLGSALAGMLLCLGLLRWQPGWFGVEPQIDGLPASYVGVLADGSGKPTLLASSRRHGRVLSVKLLTPLGVPPGQQAQLWALPRDGGPALPVAVLPVAAVKAGTTVAVELPADSETLFFKVDRLAVSLEPQSGAPAAGAAVPSTPFVASGHCVKLW